ncbi:hypothetical protein MMC06_005882, partial [Schaereria dolodes]|nr:hypothetical protein [Schaereria dolodes]
MPRDLFSTSAELPDSTASPTNQVLETGSIPFQTVHNQFIIHRSASEDREVQLSRSMRNAEDENNLHPYVQTLSLSDLDSCVALEEDAFPEHERCSREKFIYRLTTCPELSLGLFSTVSSEPAQPWRPYNVAHAPDSYTPTHRAVLLAHVIATKTNTPHVTDASIDFPISFPSHPDYDCNTSIRSPSTEESFAASGRSLVGHDESGRTLAIHSLCVLSKFQRRGLGKTILKSYMQRMDGSGLADRVALLAHDELVPWYTALGFNDNGQSAVTVGGGGWREM